MMRLRCRGRSSGSVGASRQTSQPMNSPTGWRNIAAARARRRGKREHPGDEHVADHRDHADQRHQAEVEGVRPCPGEGDGRCADQGAASELPNGRCSQWNSCRAVSGSASGPRANMVAPNSASGKHHQNICGVGRSAITTPTKPIATAIQRNRCRPSSPSSGAERGDDQRPASEGHHVGQRHSARRPVEREGIGRYAEHAQDLQRRVADVEEARTQRNHHRRA